METTVMQSGRSMQQQSLTQKALLSCGVVSTVYYVIISIIVPMQWAEYSIRMQTVSELSAIGAPTRTLWILLAMWYPVLLALFGWGVLKAAQGSRLLRVMGILIMAYSILNIYWPPMHLRETLAAGGGTLSDTLHIVWAMMTLAFNMATMGLGAAALGKGFRLYTIGTFVVFIVFGILIGTEAPNMNINGPTPFIGIYERINMAAFMIWIAVLAVVLLRRGDKRSS